MTADLPDRAAGDRERHNHFTRDIKPQGKCPACDRYHALAARPAPDDSGADCRCGAAWSGHPNPHASNCAMHDAPQPGEALKAALVRALPEAFGWARWDPRSVDRAADFLLSGPLAGLLAAARAQARPDDSEKED